MTLPVSIYASAVPDKYPFTSIASHKSLLDAFHMCTSIILYSGKFLRSINFAAFVDLTLYPQNLR